MQPGALPINSKTTDTPYLAVLYDLDGTLVDHFTSIHHAINFAEKQLGLPLSPYAKVRATVGGSIEVTFSRLIGAERAPQAIPLFHQRLAEIMYDDLHPMAGAAWLLRELHARGVRQAVLTNKTGEAARAVLKHLGWLSSLELVLGTKDTPWRKPMPEFTQHILNELKVPADRALLIGDSPFDIDAAASAKMHCRMVATGSHTSEQLLAHQPPPDAVFANLLELGMATFGLTAPASIN
jgi:phosphoglycolate phosphatase